MVTHGAMAQQSLLNKEITLDKAEGTVEEILNEMSQKGGFTFSYGNQIPLTKKIVIKNKKQSVQAYLDEIFASEAVVYFAQKNKILLSYRGSKKKENRTSVDILGGNSTIAGYVRDAASGEALVGATISVTNQSKGCVSNKFGFYSLTVPKGAYTLQFSYVGYKIEISEVEVNNNLLMNVELQAQSTELEEIVITSKENSLGTLEMGANDLSVQTIRQMPSLGGTSDIIKSLHLLPGVTTIGEGSTGFFVRGGGADQNLILLDDAPLYNASHLLGFLSVFNEDAIKNIKLYKGYFPIEYGGRLSSVLDIRMKEGNTKTFKAAGGLGILGGARLVAEGPIQKGRGSFMLSGRRTFAESLLLLAKIDSVSRVQFKDTELYFYDFNGKINYKFNDKNDVFFSAYFGRDVNKLPILDYNINWGNVTSSLRWNHIFNNRLFSNFSLSYSKYDYNLNTPSSRELFDWRSGIEDWNFKANFSYFKNELLSWKFGLNSILHSFRPGYNRSDSRYNVPSRKALENAVYAGIEGKFNDFISAEFGLRLSLFQNIGSTTIYQFNNNVLTDSISYSKGEFFHLANGFEPRFLVNFRVTDQSAIKVSYMRTLQYLQLLSNSSLSFTAFDVWHPSGPNINPLNASQYSMGYFRNFPGKGLNFSMETFYKDIGNQVDYIDNTQLVFNPYIEGELLTGKGWSYGLELLLQKTSGRFTGMFSYTYSRAKRKIPGINNGQAYPAIYDQPHKIAWTAQYEISKRFSLSANWIYNTGNPNNLPIESFEYEGKTIPVYAGRNTRRLPDYHRLDLSATIKGREKPGKKTSHYFVFSVYNAYARRNPLTIYIGEDLSINRDRDNPKTVANMAYLFSIVPTVSYNFILR
jgi:hypothetical protein